MLAIPLVFSVGRRLIRSARPSSRTGLFALSPVQVYFAQEARTYALVTLLALAGFDALLRAHDRPDRWRWWAAYAVATALSLYAHYYAFFVALGQALFVLGYHRRRSHLVPMAVALVAAALMYAPWLPSLYAQMTTKGNLSRLGHSWYMHGAISPLAFAVGTTLIWKGLAAAPRLALAALALAAFGGSWLYGFFALGDRRRERALLAGWCCRSGCRWRCRRCCSRFTPCATAWWRPPPTTC